MIIESSGWYHDPYFNRTVKTDYHYFQYPNQTSLCGKLTTDRRLSKGNHGNVVNFDKRVCSTCREMYPKLDMAFRHTKNIRKPSPSVLMVPELKTPENKWIDGVCSKCGATGVFWDGGKRTEHYCVKCLVVIAR